MLIDLDQEDLYVPAQAAQERTKETPIHQALTCCLPNFVFEATPLGIPMANKFVLLLLAISCGGASFKRKARSTQLVRSDPGHLE